MNKKDSFCVSLMFIVLMMVLMSPEIFASAAEGAHDDHGGIPWISIRGQAMNLGIVLIALIYFIRAPLVQLFKDKKDQFLEEAIKTEAALKKAESDLAEVKQRLNNLESDEKRSLEEAQKQARLASEKIISESNAQSEKIIKDVNLIIAAEIAVAKNQVKERIIAQSLASAEASVFQASTDISKRSEQGFLQDLERVNS